MDIRSQDALFAVVVGIDEDGTITLWNRQAIEVTQHTQSEVLGKTWLEALAPECCERARGALQEALAGSTVKELELTLLGGDGCQVEVLKRHSTNVHHLSHLP
jgi:PAS domain S-box-containing protein